MRKKWRSKAEKESRTALDEEVHGLKISYQYKRGMNKLSCFILIFFLLASLTGLVPLLVMGQDQYYLRVYFSSAVVNGDTLSASNPTITVSPGSRITGYFEAIVDNNRGGPWITPVIGTASWRRRWSVCISGDAPTGRSSQRFNFDLTAPDNPGTYYIGIFTGWMYTCDEVASNDHPANYGDGDDVWDMPSQGWEEVIANGGASTGPYRMPGRAIRVVVQPLQKESKMILGKILLVSGSSKGSVEIYSAYESFPQRELFVVPANEILNLRYLGILKDGDDKLIQGKEVKLFIDGKLVSSCITTAESHNVNGILTAEFSYGMHHGELRFEGDGEYQGSSYSFTLVAYKSSGFNITKDAYSFENWRYTLDEHSKLVLKLLEEDFIGSSMETPLLVIYPMLAGGGHCFGMAASSSAYYLDPSLKPKNTEVYEMSKDDPDVLWNINLYHLCQVFYWRDEREVSKSMEEVKSLIDSGTPVILGYTYQGKKEIIRHAVTIIGYYEGEGETLLIVYNNNFPNSIGVYSVKDGKLMLFEPESKAIFIDPHGLPLIVGKAVKEKLKDALEKLFSVFSGMLIHSPVDINVTSGSGRQLIVVNNTVVRNDFSESYLYVSEDYKIIILPSNESYRVELTGTSRGEVHIESVYKSDKGITTNNFQNITVNSGSKIHVPSLQSQVAYVDLDGDGSIEREARAEVVEVKAEVAPEPIPNAALILALLVTSALIIVVLLKKKMKTKIPPSPPPPPPPPPI